DQPTSFVVVKEDRAGADLFEPIVGRGSAFADIDLDGDLDVVMTQIGGPPMLLRNDQALGHRWIRLRLEGRACNRDAIGARIVLRRGGETLTRHVMPTRSYLSQSEMPVTIGLGPDEGPGSVTVHWPGGGPQTVDLPAGRLSVVVQAPLP
ncbi:MAG: ASPIC/UnbV domain-containing protein, partial [Verrucomicrobiota bacterium]